MIDAAVEDRVIITVTFCLFERFAMFTCFVKVSSAEVLEEVVEEERATNFNRTDHASTCASC